MIGIIDQCKYVLDRESNKEYCNNAISISLSAMMVEACFKKLFYHELCHIVHGHIGYIQEISKKVNGSDEGNDFLDEATTRRVLEFDADVYAMRKTLLSFRKNGDPILINDKDEGIIFNDEWQAKRLMMFVALSLFWYNKGSGAELGKHHPPALFRIWPLMPLMMERSEYLMSIRDREKANIIIGYNVFAPALAYYMDSAGEKSARNVFYIFDQHAEYVSQLLPPLVKRWALIRPHLTKHVVAGIVLPAAVSG